MKYLIIILAITTFLTGCGGGDSSQTNEGGQSNTDDTVNNQSGDDSEDEFDFGPDSGVLAPEYSNGFRVDSLTDREFTANYEYKLDQNSIELAIGGTLFGKFTLDQFNRVVGSVRPSRRQTYRISYNGAGLVSQVDIFDTDDPIANEDTPDTRKTLHYNESRQLIRMESDRGSGPIIVLELTYNNARLSSAVSNGRTLDFTVDGNGNVTSATDRFGFGERIERVFGSVGNLDSFSVFRDSGDLDFREDYQYSPIGSDLQNIQLILMVVDPFSQYSLF